MIDWQTLVERHKKGETKIGSVWIRTNTDRFVTGVYTLFGRTRKYVPKPTETWTVEDGMLVAELALEDELAFRIRFPQPN
jgi:hypothetical protein